MRRTLIIILAVLTVTACYHKTEPVDLVNPLQGTMSEASFSTGNTYPAVAVPWGMNFWTPQTRSNGDGWQYVYSDKTIQGFKQTHQPSPWINDYGCFSLMPTVGIPECRQSERAASFTHDQEVSHPYYYGVRLSSGVHVEITPTYSGAAFRLTYPSDRDAFLVVDCFGADGKVGFDPQSRTLNGSSRFYSPNNSALLPEGFATHFVLSFDTEIDDYGTIVTDDGMLCAWVKFADIPKEGIEIKTASSFISSEQAVLNLSRELAEADFDTLCAAARNLWNKELCRADVKGGTEEQQRTFYTAMYRTMLFPRRLYEQDVAGRTVHYDFFNGGVKEGYMYADNGFWDTFRAVHPFFTIMWPKMSTEIMDALLNIYREGGWLPEWFSPAYKDCMVGQHSAAVITDAHLKGIDCSDPKLMYEALLKGANTQGPNATGRRGFADYNSMGYVPYDNGVNESVSRTLEYAYNDYCISLYAASIGRDEDAALYRNRAFNYRNIFDRESGFVRPKDKNGKWQADWTPDVWGGSFTEGSAWHWTWCVYHDPRGLMNLMGGEKPFTALMDSVFVAEPTFDASYYGREIHEMTEMVAGNMGQYAHGNQPIQHMIYLYDYAGVPYKAQQHVREVIERFYSSGILDGRGLCGDEDNGQTSAWYIFSAMGFYPVCPGNSEYVIGSPLFDEVTLNLDGGRTFRVKAVGNSPRNIYIQSARLNGQPFDKCYITHNQIIEGGILEFRMGPKPNPRWGTSAESRPHSMSDL